MPRKIKTTQSAKIAPATEIKVPQEPLPTLVHKYRKGKEVESVVVNAPSISPAFLAPPPAELTAPIDEVDASKQSTKDRDVELANADLTRAHLFSTIADGLKAECVLVDKEGNEVGRVPNHTVRVKYANLAAEVLGEKISGNDSKNVNLINIYLPDQLKKARERYQKVGGPGIADMREDDGDE